MRAKKIALNRTPARALPAYDDGAAFATLTTTSAETIAWGAITCPQCGGFRIAPAAWWSIVPPKMCNCPLSATTGYIEIKTCPFCGKLDGAGWPEVLYCQCKRPRIAGLNPGNAKMSPDFDEPERAPWECPRCHRVNAPHVDRCDCPGGNQ